MTAAVRGRTAAAFVSLCAFGLLAGCSGSDDATSTKPSTESSTSEATSSSSSSDATTTSTEGESLSAQEYYESLGLSADEATCIANSPLEADVITEPTFGDDTPIAIHFEGANAPVIANSAVASVYDIERQILEALVVDCAPAAKLDELAKTTAESVMSTFDDDLTRYLNARTSDGATSDEVACLDEKFRAAPARLVGLGAAPQAIDALCAAPERRQAWRDAALRRGLAAAGADATVVECLVSTPDDLALVADVADGVGDESTVAGGEPSCGTPQELALLGDEIANEIADDASAFGVEPLVAS